MSAITSWYDTLYNAATGNLDQAQVDTLKAAESQELQASGMDPAQADAQAASDVNTVVETYRGSGGLGLTWTGAGPDQGGFGTAAAGAFKNAVDWITSHWIIILLLIAAVIVAVFWAYGGFR